MEFDFLDFYQLSEVERDRTVALAQETLFGRWMPIGFQVGESVSWVQRDSVTGLLPGKRLGDPLPQLNPTGGRAKSVPASYFGGSSPMDVAKIVRAAKFADPSTKLDIMGEVAVINAELQYKLRQMMDLQRAQLISLGRYDVYDKTETVTHSYYWDEFDNRSTALTGNAKWTAYATAKPVNNIRMMGDNYFRGTGYSFTRGEVAMSLKTASILLATDEIKAYRMGYGNSPVTVDEFNEKFTDFPKINVVEGGAHLRDGSFSPYIRDGLVVFVGAHDTRGTVLGGWDITTSEVAGIGESVFANVANTSRDGGKFPYNPICELAVQGAAYVSTDKQIAVLEVASQSDMDAWTGGP